jgi:hypothetical protein
MKNNQTPRATGQDAQHTPGPWRYEAETKTIRSKPSNHWLATLDSWDGAVNNAANAAFIVTACNSYESDQAKIKALYLAAANAADVLAAVACGDLKTINSDSPALSQLRAALALAKEATP